MAATLAETRHSAQRLSRRSDCHEPWDQVQREERQEHHEEEEEDGRRLRTFSKKQPRSRRGAPLGWSSLSYRRERVRRRLVFLQSYKLQQEEPRTRSEKLRKAVAGAVKSALVSIAGFRRMGSCVSKPCASAQAVRCC